MVDFKFNIKKNNNNNNINIRQLQKQVILKKIIPLYKRNLYINNAKIQAKIIKNNFLNNPCENNSNKDIENINEIIIDSVPEIELALEKELDDKTFNENGDLTLADDEIANVNISINEIEDQSTNVFVYNEILKDDIQHEYKTQIEPIITENSVQVQTPKKKFNINKINSIIKSDDIPITDFTNEMILTNFIANLISRFTEK
jgi:hypothetical protein